MGFFVGCLLLGFLLKTLWDFAFRKDARKSLIAQYQEQPISHVFVATWMVFFVMAFCGILVPIFGNIELSNDGWQVWEVGIIGFIAMWLITCFVDIDKLDKK
jgi:hypothetical protein